MQSIQLIIIAVLLISRFKQMTHNNIFTAFLVNILGTFLHEICHFLVGLLMFARPSSFTLIPKRSENGYILGSVSFSNIKWYNAMPVGLAPLLLIVIAYYFDILFFKYFEYSIYSNILYLFFMTILIDNAIPSTADIRNATINHIFGMIIYSLIAFLSISYFFFDKSFLFLS